MNYVSHAKAPLCSSEDGAQIRCIQQYGWLYSSKLGRVSTDKPMPLRLGDCLGLAGLLYYISEMQLEYLVGKLTYVQKWCYSTVPSAL